MYSSIFSKFRVRLLSFPSKQQVQKKFSSGKLKQNENTKLGKFFTVLSATITSSFLICIIYQLGKPYTGKDGKPLRDQYSDLPIWKQYIYRSFSELMYYTNLLKEPPAGKLLPDKVRHQPKYTLVIGFNGVLVYPQEKTGWKFKKRSGIDHFLETLSEYYEIVLYTAEEPVTLFPLVEAMDTKNYISYTLAQNSMIVEDGQYYKDLTNLNRDLSKVIVVDCDSNCTKYYPYNVLALPKWNGKDDDLTLIHLATFLLAIAENEIDDVREVIKHYNQFDNPLDTFREKQKKLIDMAEDKAARKNFFKNKDKKWIFM